MNRKFERALGFYCVMSQLALMAVHRWPRVTEEREKERESESESSKFNSQVKRRRYHLVVGQRCVGD